MQKQGKKRKHVRKLLSDFCFGKSCVTCPLNETRICEWDIVNDAKIPMARLENAEKIINEAMTNG